MQISKSGLPISYFSERIDAESSKDLPIHRRESHLSQKSIASSYVTTVTDSKNSSRRKRNKVVKKFFCVNFDKKNSE
jgi:hypothetical protein